MRISVIGTGYVGLVSGVCLAEKGHHVVCVDTDPVKVEKLNRAIPTIHERRLGGLLKKNIHVNLEVTTNLRSAVVETQLSLIAVGTPYDKGDINLQYVREAARQIGEALRSKESYHAVVVKSTVVPGTTEDVVLPLLEEASGKRAGVHFGVGMNPEFLREGAAVEDFMSPDRIVLGGIDEPTLEALEELYSVFDGVDKLRTTPRTAEMIKYAANALLATMISFSNEIGNICASQGGIDVVEVMRGVHLDRRLSPILPSGDRITPAFTTYLEAGCGFGGSCFPKDVKALIAHGKKLDRPMHLLDAVIRVNEQQPQEILALLSRNFASLKGVRIAVLGLAFKPGTDDMRESPAIPVVHALLARQAQVKAYDPVAQNEARKLFGEKPRLVYCQSLPEAIREAEAIVLLTRWKEFREIPQMLQGLEPQPLFIDGRRMLDKASLSRYVGIGL